MKITKVNLYDIGLSEEELKRRKSKKYALKKALKGKDVEIVPISAVTGKGIKDLFNRVSTLLDTIPEEEAVVVEGPIWLNNIVSVQVTFKSVSDEVQTINYQNIYYLYYEHTLYPTIEESKIETEGLLRKLSETDYSIFNSNIAEEYRESVSTALTESGITLESEPEYSYTYGTTYRRVHSDADKISYDGEYYLHCWNLDSADEQITLYRLYSNQWIWYVIAIAAALATVVVLSIINAIKKKKAKKVEVEIISPLK